MKQLKIVQVFSPQDSALYINGKLVSKWFTVEQADILTACNLKWTSIQCDAATYTTSNLPELLKDVVRHKATALARVKGVEV